MTIIAEQAIQKILERLMPIFITEGIVTSVDKNKKTCNVNREDLPELFDVRLTVDLEPGDDVVICYPSVNSKVLVAIVNNEVTDSFLLSANDLEEINCNIGDSNIRMVKDAIDIKCGSSEVSIDKAGIAIRRDTSLKDFLSTFIDRVAAITVTTPQGTSSPPINSTQIKALKQELTKIFK